MISRLLFFASDFNIGLSSLLTDELIALKHIGVNFIAIAGDKEQEPGLDKTLKDEGIVVRRINGLDEHRHYRRLAFVLRDIILHNKISIIHVQNNWQLALIVYVKFCLLKNKELKIIYTLHGFRHNYPIKSLFARYIIGIALLLFADKIICMSTYLKKKFYLLRYKMALIPLGIRNGYFIPEVPKIPTNGLQIILPAQFRHGKNHDVIIRAFAKHVSRTGDLESHVVFPGTGPLEKEYKELVKTLKMADRIHFPGFCSKDTIKELYLKCNIGIVASNSETFGQAIAEPFVLGRCVVTTHVGIADDVLEDKINGYFFENEEELSKIFDVLYKNQNLIQKSGYENYKKRNVFSWETVMRRYVELLFELVK